MLDTLGRKNRTLSDRSCKECGAQFRPARNSARYCSRLCAWKNNGRPRTKTEYWHKTKKGYINGHLILSDGTKVAVKQHRFIMEGILGRPLTADEDVHHINGIKSDNRPENLEVVLHSDHSKITNKNRQYRKGYKMNLTEEQRKARSLRAIAMRLGDAGRAAIVNARKTEK